MKKEFSTWHDVFEYLSNNLPSQPLRNNEPIQELKEMTNYYIATTQSEAEAAIVSTDYIIGSIDGRGHFSISEKPAIHKEYQTATKEAKRLTSINPGTTFVVLRLMHGYRAGGILEF